MMIDMYVFITLFNVSDHQPRPYRTLKTRANDGTRCLQMNKIQVA